MNIGFIGLGALGSNLARRFLAAHTLTVFDLDPPAMDRLATAGASAARTPAELARSCDVVLLCLPRSSDVEQASFGPAGLGETLTPGLTPGKLVIDQTSGVPYETRAMAARLGQRGVAMIDAAVSGSPQLELQGGATLMASGPAEAYAKAPPVLQVITPTVDRCGARVGDGQAMKMINNTMNCGCRLGTLEVVAMGHRLGLSLEAMRDTLNSGDARNQT